MVETLIYEKPLTEETSWNKTNIKNNNSSSTRPDSLPEENVALIGTTRFVLIISSCLVINPTL